MGFRGMSVDALLPMMAAPEPCSRQDASALPLARWTALAGLLVAEILLLTVRFDTVSLGENTAWWALLLGQSGQWLRLGIAAVTATLLISSGLLWDELRRGHGRLDQPHRWWPLFLGHLAAYAGFFELTALVLEGNIARSAYPAAWFLLWLATGGLTLTLLALAALPGCLWLALARRGAKGLVLGGLIGLAACLASYLTRQWELLGEWTFWVVQYILHLFYQDIVCVPGDLMVGTTAFSVQVAPECSGYEGVGLMCVFTAVYLTVFRQRLRFPRALLLLPLGAVVIWLSNAVRLAALIAIGSAGWPDLALGGFHSQAGWLGFNVVALGLVACSGRLGMLTVEAMPLRRSRAADPTLAYLAPFLAILAMKMLTEAFSTTPEAFYPLQVLTAVGALWWFRQTYGPIGWSWSWPPLGIGAATALLWIGWMATFAADASATAAGLPSLSESWAPLWGMFRLIGYVLVVPIAEELAFRGYLIRRLSAADFLAVPGKQFTWVSFVITAVLFGALHGANWLPGLTAGMLFALAVYHRGRLGDAVAAHVTANALLAVYGLFTQNWHVLS